MQKIEMKIALDMFDAKKIGEYKIDGQKTDMYLFKDCIFYFDGKSKVIVIGHMPMGLGYHIFLNFSGNKFISFENDNRGQWYKENIYLDSCLSEEERNNLFSKELHRIYTISSLDTLLAFILFNYHYENEEKIGIRNPIDTDNKEETDTESARLHRFRNLVNENALYALHCKDKYIMKNMKVLTAVPKIPETCTISKVEETIDAKSLMANLQNYDYTTNPLQFSQTARNSYPSYAASIDVGLEFDDRGFVKVTYNPCTSTTKSSYECSKNHITYDSVVQIGEIQYLKMRHMYSKYRPGDHTSGEILEIIRSVSPNSFVPTKRTIIYNLTENLILKDDKWQRVTAEDIDLLTMMIADMTNRVQNDITGQMTASKTIKFIPVTEL